jgi:small subunit ribosomal protein S16
MAMFDIVVATNTAPRDGRFIEKIGTYNPNTIPASIVLDNGKALKWLLNGAQPTDTTRAILSYKGVMYAKHLQVGVNKGALSQEEADAKVAAWIEAKESKISGRVDSLSKAKEKAAKDRLAAETKVNEARIAAIAAKQAAEIAAANPAPEVSAEEAPVAEAVESVAETPVAETSESAEAPTEEVKEVAAEAPAAEEVVAETKEETPAAE